MAYTWKIMGHEKEVELLEGDIACNNVHHAYLFTGPAHIGKFHVAKKFAEALECSKFDTIELEDDGESIGIDAVRQIISRICMTGQSRYKIVLMQNIERLTDQASNCLLKNLEEPPKGTVFLCTAEKISDLASTIVSRMRIIKFKKNRGDALIKILRERYPEISQETIAAAMDLSMGAIGKAVQFLEDPAAFEELRAIYEKVKNLDAKSRLARRMIDAREIAENPKALRMFIEMFAHFYRKSMLQSPSYAEKLKKAALLLKAHEALNLAGKNINPRLLMENLMLHV